MSKKKTNNFRNNISAPEITNMEILSYASDQEIESRRNFLTTEKNAAINAGYDPYLWEVELAYVEREVAIRDSRRVAHEAYLKTNPEILDSQSNDFLDDSNFDTSWQ